MRLLWLLGLSALHLFAANLLTYNVYERSDRIDVMLSFDTPHEGAISQKNETGAIVLSISDLHYDKLVEKSINSTIIQELAIMPESKSLKIILKSTAKIGVVASKTVDGFGLRIRASIAQPSAQTPTPLEPIASPRAPEQDFELLDSRYMMVIALLIVLLGLMVWVRKRLLTRGITPQQNSGKSWLFNPKTGLPQEVNLLHKKPLDPNNSVVLFEYGSIRYLVMTGNTNVLLEKFQDGEVKDTNDFEKIFEQNRKRLDEYLKLQDSKLNSYKNKASADYQNVDA